MYSTFPLGISSSGNEIQTPFSQVQLLILPISRLDQVSIPPSGCPAIEANASQATPPTSRPRLRRQALPRHGLTQHRQQATLDQDQREPLGHARPLLMHRCLTWPSVELRHQLPAGHGHRGPQAQQARATPPMKLERWKLRKRRGRRRVRTDWSTRSQSL